MANQLDILFAQLGTGKWNLLHYFAIGYAVSLPVPHALAGPFLAPRLKYKCHLPPDMEATIIHTNHTHMDSCSYTVRIQDGDLEEEEEEMFCTQWYYDNSIFTNTVTSEFDLVCQREYLRATYQSMYMIGVLVGSPINGILSDRYGRKTTFGGCCLLFMIMANISCWLPNFPSLLVFRFFLGTMHTAILKTGFIMAMEIADPKVRSVVGVTLFFPWGLGTMLWGGLAYLQRSWRYLLMTVSLPCLLLLPALWFMDESPRWLIVRGQHARALQVLKKAARWNGVKLPPDEEIIYVLKDNTDALSEVSKTKECEKKRSWKSIVRDNAKGIIILFRTPHLRVATLVMCLDYLVLGMVYFGLSLSGGNFNFNAFSYMALMGLVETPAYTVMAPILSRFGRRVPIATLYLSSGAVLLALPFLPSSNQWLVVSFALIGKMTISMAFQGNNVFATDVFPTEVRTRGVSSSFMLSRVGSSVAPFINDYLGFIYPWAPSVVFGVAAVVAGLATLTLWETLGMTLPDTIAQLESLDFKSKRTYFKKLPTSELEVSQPETTTTKV